MRIVENIKSIILTFLILSSLVLTGSLWFDNYQGLSLAISKIPNSFFSKSNPQEYSKIYSEIIMPHKVTVTNPDENKWVSYASDKMTLDAWNLLKNRLSNITTGTEIITGKVKEWDELINRKSIIIEFGGPIDEEIFSLAVPNLPKDTEAFNNVEKFSITKSLVGNTIYIMQNDNDVKKLYKILLKGEDEEVKAFMQSAKNIKTDVSYVTLSSLGTTKFYNNKSVDESGNVLFPIANRQDKRDMVSMLNVKNHFDSSDTYLMGRFVTDIFNNTDFAKFTTSDDINIYINDDKSTIKIANDGIIEYINNGKASDEEMSAGKNLDAALDFINGLNVFDSFFLQSATRANEEYTFKFSVAYDGIVAGFRDPIIGDDIYTVLEVKTENNEITYFKGKLVELNLVNQKSYIYQVAHNILDNLLKNVEADTNVTISELGIFYDISKQGSSYPCWVTRYDLPKNKDIVTSISVTNR